MARGVSSGMRLPLLSRCLSHPRLHCTTVSLRLVMLYQMAPHSACAAAALLDVDPPIELFGPFSIDFPLLLAESVANKDLHSSKDEQVL
jgi:hypothetical protein